MHQKVFFTTVSSVDATLISMEPKGRDNDITGLVILILNSWAVLQKGGLRLQTVISKTFNISRKSGGWK